MDEIFLEDEETGLLVSNIGRVIGKQGKEIKGRKERGGYLAINYSDRKTKKRRNIKIHRLVANNFLPNPLLLPQVNHKDENPANNCVDNLEWCSPKYNCNYGTRTSRIISTQISRSLTMKCLLEKDGIIVTANSTREMARIINSQQTAVANVIKGIIRHTKGWHLPTNITPKNEEV